MTCTECEYYFDDDEFKEEFEEFEEEFDDEDIVGFCYIPGSTIDVLYNLGGCSDLRRKNE